MFEYFGILAIVIMPLLFYICWIKSNKISLKIHPLSKFGIMEETKYWFVFTMIAIGLSEILFLLEIIYFFNLEYNLFLFYAPIISIICFGLIGCFSLEKYKILHYIFTFIYFILILMWAIYFSYVLLNVDFIIGLLALIISSSTALGIVFIFFIIKVTSYFELYLLFNTILWNLLFTYVLLL